MDIQQIMNNLKKNWENIRHSDLTDDKAGSFFDKLIIAYAESERLCLTIKN